MTGSLPCASTIQGLHSSKCCMGCSTSWIFMEIIWLVKLPAVPEWKMEKNFWGNGKLFFTYHVVVNECLLKCGLWSWIKWYSDIHSRLPWSDLHGFSDGSLRNKQEASSFEPPSSWVGCQYWWTFEWHFQETPSHYDMLVQWTGKGCQNATLKASSFEGENSAQNGFGSLVLK